MFREMNIEKPAGLEIITFTKLPQQLLPSKYNLLLRSDFSISIQTTEVVL